MPYTFPAIDAVLNFEFDIPGLERPAWGRQFVGEKIGADLNEVTGLSPERVLEKMDRAGIDHALLIAVKAGSPHHPINRVVPYEAVAEIVRRYPTRFSGLAGIDPTEGMKGVRRLEYAVKELGFAGAHLYPHWFEMAPDHARYYPFYAKCIELDVPIQMQIGHCLRYSEDRPLPSVGRPMTLDTVACHLPELKLVGIHMGWPWVDEMIAVAYKHPNVYIGCDAYAPKYWPPQFVHYVDSFGSKKVIFGSDFPVIDPERSRAEIETLPIRDASKRRLLRDNVIDLYKLNLKRTSEL